MGKKSEKLQNGTIIKLLARYPKGVPIRQLLEQEELAGVAKRTLQRRLDQMIRAGEIESEGAGRGFRYLPKSKRGGEMIPSLLREETEEYPVPDRETPPGEWLSSVSKELRAAVTRPLFERKAAPYDDAWLVSYQPNVTRYLSPELCAELGKMGRVGKEGLPVGTYLREVMDRLIIDLSWNSSRLEGNTYSILETQRLLEIGEGADGKSLAEAQMILNHKNAIEILSEMSEEAGFNRYTIFNLHAALAEGLLPREEAAGCLRYEAVGVSGTSFKPLLDPPRVEESFARILQKAEAITDPFEQAFFAMVHLPYLQPFIDVNKRTSRLVANIPLMHHNLCPLSFVGVSRDDYLHATLAVYELQRVDYLRDVFVLAYRKSCDRYSEIRQVLGDPNPLYVRYRRDVHHYIRQVVEAGMDKRQAANWIHDESVRGIEEENRAGFIEMVETVLSGLHEGNIARYRLRPGPFREWLAGWR